jgi:hypothetical protein
MTPVSLQSVIPAQAGIQISADFLDSRLRGNDEMWRSSSVMALKAFLK